MSRGSTINAGLVGLLASAGYTQVPVQRQPVVGILSTGDEVTRGNNASIYSLEMGKIRDANGPMLAAALGARGFGVKIVDLGRVKDSRADLRDAISSAIHRDDIDVVITTGGVSMGAKDLTKELLENLGTVHFGRLRMKPGKPTTFASVMVEHQTEGGIPASRKKVVFSLPGNPVSALVTCNLLVVPALRRLAGVAASLCHSPRIVVELAHDFPLDPVRNAYHRVRLAWDVAKNRYRVGACNAGQFGELHFTITWLFVAVRDDSRL